MSFNQLVIRNTLRNKHLYLAYFLSTMFSVMVFFTFNVFVYHPMLQNGLNENVQTGMTAAAVIIYGFAFFFVLYSMDVFLQSRKKEFGVLMIQGMSPKQLRKMVFIENIVIGFFATISGSIAGIAFSQVILWISKFLVHVDFGFYFPTMAFIITIASFFVLFLAISFFIQLRLPKLTLQELLKAGDLGKGSLKASPVKAVLAVLLIGGGYAVAIMVPGMLVPIVMLPVIFVVVVGTNFLYNQLSVGIIEALKKRQSLFWKKTNMVVFSDLAFRMKDNARSFFLVSVISTVAFAAIGTLYGFQDLFVGQIDQSPYEVQLEGTPSAELDQQIQLVNDCFSREGITNQQDQLTVYASEEGQEIILVSDYNRLAELAGESSLTVASGQVIQLKMPSFNDTIASDLSLNGTTYQNAGMQETSVVPAYGLVYVVADDTPLENLSASTFYAWKTQGASHEQLVAVGNELYEADPMIQPKTAIKQSILDDYAPVLFVGIFIGIVFFVSAGSFLYFRLYSDMDVDVEKFKMIYKLGLSKKELRKMIYQQVGILFFTPIIVSFVHGAVALTAMYHLFDQSMQLAGWQVLGAFILIQIIYYLVARMFYFRTVYQNVTA